MNVTKDGGPAFPVPDLYPGAMQAGSYGMSLRDWFAGQEVLEDECADLPTATMEALAGRPYPGASGTRTTAQDRLDVLAWNADWRAGLKFLRADAMLRARERGRESDGDEAWFAKQPDACVSVAEDMSWASCEARGRVIAERGSTRAAAIRALRAKVEGGGQ